jgi:hypothetical protein
MSDSHSSGPLKRTPLFEACAERGGKMIDFGGWELPVQFSGILEEHAPCASAPGCSTSPTWARSPSGDPKRSIFSRKLTSNDVSKLEDGRMPLQRPALPDRRIRRRHPHLPGTADDYLVVVNASNTEKDLRVDGERRKEMDVAVENRERGLRAAGDPGSRGARRPPEADRRRRSRTIKYYRFARGKVTACRRSSRGPATRARTASRSTSPPMRRPECSGSMLEAGKRHGLFRHRARSARHAAARSEDGAVRKRHRRTPRRPRGRPRMDREARQGRLLRPRGPREGEEDGAKRSWSGSR